MTVSVGIKHLDTGRYDVVPVATNEVFTSRWQPACARLGLRLVAHLHDGTFATADAEDIREIAAELETLRAWAAENERSAHGLHMIERIDGILQALRESASEVCEYDFG